MGSRGYVGENDPFEVAASRYTVEVKEHIKAVLRQVLVNCKRPRNIGAAIIEKNVSSRCVPYSLKSRGASRDRQT
jgi:hypothetical protein